MSNSYQLPELTVGDLVLYHDNPLHPDPKTASMGWISRRPGNSTVNILVWAEDAGFVEKPSVRHADDPFWRESEMAGPWSKWGAFTLHPNTESLKEIKALLTRMKLEQAAKVNPSPKKTTES
jgi:hypothetical protein